MVETIAAPDNRRSDGTASDAQRSRRMTDRPAEIDSVVPEPSGAMYLVVTRYRIARRGLLSFKPVSTLRAAVPEQPGLED
jgi:hypothetical protein